MTKQTKTACSTRSITSVYTGLAIAVSSAARRYEMLGHTQKAIQLLGAILEFADPGGSPVGRALLMADLGGIVWKQGHYNKALELLTEAKTLAEKAGDRLILATALYHLGELAYVKVFMMQAGELEEALAYHEQCLALRREIADRPGMTLSLSRIGVLHERMQKYDVALAYHDQAVEMASAIDYPFGTIRPYTHIGGSHRRNGDLHMALTFYQKALDISRKVGSHEDIVFGSINVGWTTYCLHGDSETALDCFQGALKRLDFQSSLASQPRYPLNARPSRCVISTDCKAKSSRCNTLEGEAKCAESRFKLSFWQQCCFY